MGLNIDANNIVGTEEQRNASIEKMCRQVEQQLAKWKDGDEKYMGIAVHGVDKLYINDMSNELISKGFTVEVFPTDMQTDLRFRW